MVESHVNRHVREATDYGQCLDPLSHAGGGGDGGDPALV